MALIDKLTAIGDAIRNQNGITDPLTLDEMAQKIRDFEGKIPVIQPLTVNENGTFTPDAGVDGFSPVIVQTPETVVEEITITENGIYEPDAGVDGFNKVIVETVSTGDIPSGEGVKW